MMLQKGITAASDISEQIMSNPGVARLVSKLTPLGLKLLTKLDNGSLVNRTSRMLNGNNGSNQAANGSNQGDNAGSTGNTGESNLMGGRRRKTRNKRKRGTRKPRRRI